MFHLKGNLKKLASYSLSHYESLLPTKQFNRVHKSHIVNLSAVIRYDGGRMGRVYLIEDKALDIAARRKSAFIRAMK